MNSEKMEVGPLKLMYKRKLETTLWFCDPHISVIEVVKKWQNHTLQEVYLVVYFDALVVKGKSDSQAANRSVYLTIGINMEGLFLITNQRSEKSFAQHIL